MLSPVEIALRYRWTVLGLTAAMAILGVWSLRNQRIEAYPDISGQMVQVITVFPGRAAEDVVRQVTVPIERAMGNVPRVQTIRSRTIFGLSVVQLSFEEGVESYWARQRVAEKLPQIELPEGVSPELGPLATAYGEVLRYELVSNGTSDSTELRTLNDWVVIPRLLRVPGVAEVSNFGGQEKRFAVVLEPSELARFGLPLRTVVDALRDNNADAGGSVLNRGGMSFVVRGRGTFRETDDIARTFVTSHSGTPVTVGDVGSVVPDVKIASGIFGKDENDDGVEGIVLMRRGENTSDVLALVRDAIDELNTGVLPPGVRVAPFYDRQDLVDDTLHTVTHSVVLGIMLVITVLILILGRVKMAALVALTIPFSLLFALVAMSIAGIPIGLLSIGAIDFGIIVDGAVIMADSIAHRLGGIGTPGPGRNITRSILAAAQGVQRAVFFSMLMIIGAYLPLLTLQRIEGLLFRPMALTLVFALVGALLFTLFTLPALASLLFRSGYREWHNPVLARLQVAYAALVRALLARRVAFLSAAFGVLLAAILLVVPRLGFEFLPYIDEGVVWVRANFPDGMSLEETARQGSRIRAIVRSFPDIEFVSTQTGRNDSGTDPFPPSRMEIMIGPKPSAEWTQFRTKQDLVAAIGGKLRAEFPTTRFNFTQPIIDSVTEDTNGTSANLAVEYQGPDPAVLFDLAQRTVGILRGVPGAVDVNIEQEGPQPQLVVETDRDLAARYGVRVDDVRTVVDTAIGGEAVSSVWEGDRRYDIAVRFDRDGLASPDAIGRLPVHTAEGVAIPVGQVASIELVDGQTTIAREGGKQRITVRADIVGRDQGGFVEEAQRAIAQQIEVPQGYRVSWLGMFENLERARQHFATVIPITIGLIYVLLLATFRSQRAALLLLFSVPFAFVGGAVALFLRGIHLNVSTGVGFAALFGVSIMNGVLLVRSITTQRLQGMAIDDAIVEGAERCLRPILMASLVAILGLLPASLASGVGSDVQRPLATVIVWGLLSALVLTLLVVPALYRVLEPALVSAAPPPEQLAALAAEPLPDVTALEVVKLVEQLHMGNDDEAEIFDLPDQLGWDFGRVTLVVQAARMLGFVEAPQQLVRLGDVGRRFAAEDAVNRRRLWRERLLELRLFRLVRDVLLQAPERTIDRDFVLETIVLRMPREDYERIFNTMIRWARFGELFSYDPASQRLSLGVA